MKKFGLMIITLMFALPFVVKAETNPKVLTVEASANKNTIEYKGTTEEDAHAVMCKLYNSKDEELDLLSSAVDGEKFTGIFTVKEKGEYKVACANYEGGEIKNAKVTVTNVDNPDTYDSGITMSVMLLAISIGAVVFLALYLKHNKKETKKTTKKTTKK